MAPSNTLPHTPSSMLEWLGLRSSSKIESSEPSFADAYARRKANKALGDATQRLNQLLTHGNARLQSKGAPEIGNLLEAIKKKTIFSKEPLSTKSQFITTYNDNEGKAEVSLSRGAELGRGNFGVVYLVKELRQAFKNERENGSLEETSCERALKISVARTGRHLAAADEFKKLLLLYENGVPVPRPLKMIYHEQEEKKISQFAILMDLVRGCTLRDWLNNQPGELDELRYRTVHPVRTVTDAILRIDVAIELVLCLIRLHSCGFFVDLKPRNIMLGSVEDAPPGAAASSLNESRSSRSPRSKPCEVSSRGADSLDAESAHRISGPNVSSTPSGVSVSQSFPKDCECSSSDACTVPRQTPTVSNAETQRGDKKSGHDRLKSTENQEVENKGEWDNYEPFRGSSLQQNVRIVDLGGFVLKDEVSAFFDETNEYKDKLATMWFNVVSDRQKLETTSSYISPEIAALVIQNDVLRGKAENHFAPTLPYNSNTNSKNYVGKSRSSSRTGDTVDSEVLEKEWQDLVRPYLEDTFVIHHRIISGGQRQTLHQWFQYRSSLSVQHGHSSGTPSTTASSPMSKSELVGSNEVRRKKTNFMFQSPEQTTTIKGVSSAGSKRRPSGIFETKLSTDYPRCITAKAKMATRPISAGGCSGSAPLAAGVSSSRSAEAAPNCSDSSFAPSTSSLPFVTPSSAIMNGEDGVKRESFTPEESPSEQAKLEKSKQSVICEVSAVGHDVTNGSLPSTGLAPAHSLKNCKSGSSTSTTSFEQVESSSRKVLRGGRRAAQQSQQTETQNEMMNSTLRRSKRFEEANSISCSHQSRQSASLFPKREQHQYNQHQQSDADKEWWAQISDRSTSFTLGLLLVELFGGHRTGITGLARQPSIQSIFMSRTTDVEFRICCEWEARRYSVPSVSKTEPVSFKDMYIKFCYPNSGVLGIRKNSRQCQQGWSGSGGHSVDSPHEFAVSDELKALLDRCLSVSPTCRPNLREIIALLLNIRKSVIQQTSKSPFVFGSSSSSSNRNGISHSGIPPPSIQTVSTST